MQLAVGVFATCTVFARRMDPYLLKPRASVGGAGNTPCAIQSVTLLAHMSCIVAWFFSSAHPPPRMRFFDAQLNCCATCADSAIRSHPSSSTGITQFVAGQQAHERWHQTCTTKSTTNFQRNFTQAEAAIEFILVLITTPTIVSCSCPQVSMLTLRKTCRSWPRH
jgi:hypothetical protein